MKFRNCLKKLLCVYLSVALICCSFGTDKKRAYASTRNISDVADCYHALSLIADDSCITEISDKDIDTAADAVIEPEPDDLGITYTQEGKALHEYGYYKSTNPVNLCDSYMYTKFTEVNDDAGIKAQNAPDKPHNYTQPSDQIAQEGKS